MLSAELLIFSSVFFGLCVSVRQHHQEVCYGRNLRFHIRYAPPLYNGPLYFSPYQGGPMKILMDEGKSQDPRLDVSFDGVILRDVTEDDEGYFSVSVSGNRLQKIMKLTVLDCAEEITKEYWDSFQLRVPFVADVLEFTPLHDLKQPVILWNRSNGEMNTNGRGSVENNLWNFPDLTQKDNGYYHFREKDRNIVSRILLNVKEHTETLTADEDDGLEMVYPWLAHMKTMTFKPEGEEETLTVITDGRVGRDYWFNSRIQVVTNGVEFFRLKGKDSGTYRFKDSEYNLIMTVQLKVNDDFLITTVYSVSIGLLFPATIMLYCCRCYAKHHYKKYHSAPETPAPPAVNDHGSNQAAGPAAPPSSTRSYHPVNVPKAPTVASSGPPVYQPVKVHVAPTQPEVCEPVNVPTQPQVYQPANVNVTPPQPEVPLSGGWKPTVVPPISSHLISSDCEPVFKPKGVEYSSASLLSSDSTLCDVYTSDKLNFL